MFKRFFKEEEGASLVEYGLLVALIAAVCAAIIGTLGGSINTIFNRVNDEIQTATTAGS